MFALDAPPAQVQPCDPGARQAAIDGLEDRAFAAMKAATERVAEASRQGPVGTAGDAEFAAYKRLRRQADALRATPGGCPAQTVAEAAPAPVLAARTPETAAAAPVAASDDWSRPRGRRFRVELSANTADNQPSAASRFGMRVFTGTTSQFFPVGIFSNTTPPSPPRTEFPAPAPTGNFRYRGTPGPLVEGPQPDVKGWSSGLSLAVNFAPGGLDQAGWRWGAQVDADVAETRSSTIFPPYAYTINGPQNAVWTCGLIAASGPARYACGYTVSTPVSLPIYSTSLQPNFLSEDLSADYVRQTARRLNGRVNGARAFDIGSPLGVLRASLGGEMGFGWWTIRERESLYHHPGGEAPSYYSRTANGPTALVGLTAGLGGGVWKTPSLRWSIQSALDYELADLGQAGNIDDAYTGRLGARLDYVHGPLGAFIAADRRIDMAVVSTISGPSVGALAGGDTFALWRTYGSRLTVGVNYGF